MKFTMPHGACPFEIPDEWWEAGGMVDFTPKSSHYQTDSESSLVVSIDEVEPPLRSGGVIWFRDQNTVVQLLMGMRNDAMMPPIKVWSKEKKRSTKYVVHDGLHRFYLSVAIGYAAIPVEVDDFDLDEFFANEAKGISAGD